MHLNVKPNHDMLQRRIILSSDYDDKQCKLIGMLGFSEAVKHLLFAAVRWLGVVESVSVPDMGK